MRQKTKTGEGPGTQATGHQTDKEAKTQNKEQRHIKGKRSKKAKEAKGTAPHEMNHRHDAGQEMMTDNQTSTLKMIVTQLRKNAEWDAAGA